MSDVADGQALRVASSDLEKKNGVRRMKLVATGFLVLAVLLFVFARWMQGRGAGGWAEYLESGAEAGMVGALADWFAVTALFRRPLGLPIPHTAIIPTKKDALGQNLGDFVGDNFLSEGVVRQRLASMAVSGRLGAWLAEPEHADRVTAELSNALHGALTVMRDEDVRNIFGQALTRRVSAQAVAQPIGALLDRLVAEGSHHGIVDMVTAKAHDWLADNQESVLRVVEQESPGWAPSFLDRSVAKRVHKELVKFAGAVRDDPEHPARRAADTFLAEVAGDLQHNPQMIAQVEAIRDRTLAHPQVQDLITSVWTAIRAMLVESVQDPDSELRGRISATLRGLGTKLAEDPRMGAKVDGWIQDAATYVVTTYRQDITALITDTVQGWDPEETSKKIELNVGRDLQFIRINGTVVGALAGLAIHTLTELV